MNGRADESASDKHEVTGIEHCAEGALAQSCQILLGKGMNSLGPSRMLREAWVRGRGAKRTEIRDVGRWVLFLASWLSWP